MSEDFRHAAPLTDDSARYCKSVSHFTAKRDTQLNISTRLNMLFSPTLPQLENAMRHTKQHARQHANQHAKQQDKQNAGQHAQQQDKQQDKQNAQQHAQQHAKQHAQ